MGWLSDFRGDVRRFSDCDEAPHSTVLKSKGLWALLHYRVAHQYRTYPLARPALFLWRMAVESLTGIEISSQAEIGRGCYIGHFGGIHIGSGVVMGCGCLIHQGVTIGAHRDGWPTIGNGCDVAPGAVVVGGITIGDNVAIGANAVVCQDLPDGAIVRAAPISVKTPT